MKDLLQMIHDALQDTGTRLLMIGGLAVSQYRAVRQTFDLDFAISQKDAPVMVQALQNVGFTEHVSTPNFVRLKTSDHPFLVDLLFMDASTFEKLWEKRTVRRIADRDFAVAAPDHIIRMKLHAIRYGKASRIDKDLPDILNLMSVCGWTDRSPELREACLQHANENIYAIIVERWKNRFH